MPTPHGLQSARSSTIRPGVGPLTVDDETVVEQSERPSLLVLLAKTGPVGSFRVRLELRATPAGTTVHMHEEPVEGLATPCARHEPGDRGPQRGLAPPAQAARRAARLEPVVTNHPGAASVGENAVTSSGMLRAGGAPAPDVLPRRGRQRADRVHRSVIAVGTLIGRAVGKLGLRARLRRRRRIPVGVAATVIKLPQHLMPAWTQPRAAPPALLPAAAGAIVIAVALPIFLIAGWRDHRLGARRRALGRLGGARLVVLTRLQSRTGNLAAAGVAGFRNALSRDRA